MKTITPCLWFDTQGEEAARFYTAIYVLMVLVGAKLVWDSLI